MKFLETKHQRKSFTISVLLFVLMFIVFFFVGLKYLDPPPENGIAINFGTSDEGFGEFQPTEPINSDVQPLPMEESVDPPLTEEVVTQDTEEAPVIKEAPKKKEVKKEVVKEEVKKAPPAPTPSKNTSDALSSLINGPKSAGTANQGQGDDQSGGDKGRPNGDLYSNIYYGSGSGNGLNNGGSWGLNGRKLASNSIVTQKCNEQGKVVLQVWVGRDGKVIKARQSKGTDNSAQCLIEAAQETIKTFSWQPDPEAPKVQVGFIVINFKLG